MHIHSHMRRSTHTLVYMHTRLNVQQKLAKRSSHGRHVHKDKSEKDSTSGCSCNSDTPDSGLPYENENAMDIGDKHGIFLSELKEAVTNGGTKNLWKEYGKGITMQFKDRNLEAKVCIHMHA